GPARTLPPPGEDPGAGRWLPGQVRRGAGDRGNPCKARRGRQGASPPVGRLHPVRPGTLNLFRRQRAWPTRTEREGSMTRVLVGLVLGMTLMGGWCIRAADDPPTELTPEQRKELEAKFKELTDAMVRFDRAGKLPEAAEAAQKALETARRLYPKQDHPTLAASLNNLAIVLQKQGKYADTETFFREA